MSRKRREYMRHSAKVTRTRRWKALRLQILRRDDFQCVQCGERRWLEVDHIEPVRTCPEGAYAPGNLQTLCKSCHARKTREEIGLGEISPARQAWRALLLSSKGKISNA
ncbi:MAG: HNH endonuclease signature motif containing protein [Pseudomonadota bacterium]